MTIYPTLQSGNEPLPSVNLGFDGQDPTSKLTDFYLSKKGAIVIETVLSSLEAHEKRKRIGTITAPPGSGKSYLALFLGSLLYNQKSWNKELLTILESQNKSYRAEIEKSVRDYISSGQRLIPVYMVGESENLRRNILENLLSGLSQFSGDENFYETLFSFFKKDLDLQRKSGDTRRLIAKIADTYSKPDDFFIGYKLILDFCASFEFNGFVIFNDEFNRLLAREQAVASGDLDFLQDFAEYNLRLKSFTVLHYLLLHKGISQYLNGISSDRRKEWLKIEGRFYQINFQEELADTYGLIANYLRKNTNFKLTEKRDEIILAEIKRAWKINPFLEEEIGPELKEISHKAYPLHISTLVALPLLCNLLGQNERTLFGYLSDIPSRKKTDQVFLDDLFDYFDTSIDKLGLDDSLLTRWHYGRSAIAETTEKETFRVIKALTVLSVVNRHNLLPANAKWISFALGIEEPSVKATLKELVSANLALYRETNKTYLIYYGSSIDLISKMDELAPSISISSVSKTLEDAFRLSPVYANSYNAEYFTSRFYSRKFLLEENIREYIQFKSDEDASETLIKDRKESFSKKLSFFLPDLLKEILEKEKRTGSSGVILYYLGNPNSEIAKTLRSFVTDERAKKNFLCVFSENTFQDLHLLKKYVACTRISEDPEILRQDSRVKNDARIYLNDLFEKIQFTIRSQFTREESKLTAPLTFDKQDSLQKIVSSILSERFPDCPKVNSEFINREHISPIIRNTRKKILRDMISGEPSLGLRDKGYGPDVAIFRSLFTNKGIYGKKEGKIAFTLENTPQDYLGNKDDGLKKVFAAIHKYLLEESEARNLDRLYEILTSEPYGMYSEMIPFYFLAALLEKSYSFSLYEEDRYEKEINSDILEKLHSNPKNFKIRIIRSNAVLEKYLLEIPKIFTPGESARLSSQEEARILETRKINENKIYRSVISLLYWYTKLPECTRHTKELSADNSRFLQAISHSVNPEILLLEEIPELFGYDLNTLNETGLTKFLSKLIKTKQEIAGHYDTLLARLSSETVKILNAYVNSPTAHKDLLSTLAQFRSDNEYKLGLLKTHDSSFQKLFERLSFRYDSETALLESLASLLCDLHPRYWKDNTLMEYEFKLTSELSKIHIATLMSSPGESSHLKIERILVEYRSLRKEERQLLISRLESER
jgi:hypothetical protein